MRRIAVLIALSSLIGSHTVASAAEKTIQREELRIRDPFVLPVESEGKYYLYGTGSRNGQQGFFTYTSENLEDWTGPIPAFIAPEGFWGLTHFWAPEVFAYQGKYYMFATFANVDPIRGTQILVSESPAGPFKPLGDGSQTPRDWQCLDGTLHIDKAGAPWMVFCHEWTQVGDGQVCAIRLSKDLSKRIGEAKILFRASALNDGLESTFGKKAGRVTDGPWLHRLKNGRLIMLWSTFAKGRDYCVTIAKSASDTLEGPWEQSQQFLFEQDGGHCMLFKTFDGQLMVSLHQPNKHPRERACFFPVKEEGDLLKLVQP